MAYLLMPTSLLLETIQGVDLLNWPNLYRLRDLFQVTITALTVRLTRLNLLYVADDKQLFPSRQEYDGQMRLVFDRRSEATRTDGHATFLAGD